MAEFILGGRNPRERFLVAWRAVRSGTFMNGDFTDENTKNAIFRIAEALSKGRYSDDPEQDARIKLDLKNDLELESEIDLLRGGVVAQLIKSSWERDPNRWSQTHPSPLMRNDLIRQKGPDYEWWKDPVIIGLNRDNER